jgi:hypothetical protein
MSLLRPHRIKLIALALTLAAIGIVSTTRAGATPACAPGDCAGGPGHPNECIAQHTCHQGIIGGYIECINGNWVNGYCPNNVPCQGLPGHGAPPGHCVGWV